MFKQLHTAFDLITASIADSRFRLRRTLGRTASRTGFPTSSGPEPRHGAWALLIEDPPAQAQPVRHAQLHLAEVEPVASLEPGVDFRSPARPPARRRARMSRTARGANTGASHPGPERPLRLRSAVEERAPSPA